MDDGSAYKTSWNRIKVTPTKWQLPPWGDDGGGFWVVALIGQECIYYNDIEEGFNTSYYQVFGHIKDYYCEQFDLLSFLHSYSGLLRKDLNENA